MQACQQRCLCSCQAADSEAAPSSPSQQSKELKGLYREQYSELQMVRAEADYTQKLVEQCMQELVHDFQGWYGGSYALSTMLIGRRAATKYSRHVLVDDVLHLSQHVIFDSAMAGGHLAVFIAFSIMMCNTVKHEIYSAATVPLVMLLSVLMHRHQHCFPYMQVCCYLCTTAP